VIGGADNGGKRSASSVTIKRTGVFSPPVPNRVAIC
jgi:hypothetical protein